MAWWNEKVKDTVVRKKKAVNELCMFTSEKYKTPCKRIRNQTRKAVAGAMRKEAEKEFNNLCQNSNSVFSFLRESKRERS